MQLSLTDLGWAAGIMDGEGHIMIRKQKVAKGRPDGRYYFGLRVANTDVRMVMRMKELLGGLVTGPRLLRLSTKPVYEWQANGRQALAALRAISPYLVVKGDQAEIAMRFARTMVYDKYGGNRRLPLAVVKERDQMVIEMKQIRSGGER